MTYTSSRLFKAILVAFAAASLCSCNKLEPDVPSHSTPSTEQQVPIQFSSVDAVLATKASGQTYNYYGWSVPSSGTYTYASPTYTSTLTSTGTSLAASPTIWSPLNGYSLKSVASSSNAVYDSKTWGSGSNFVTFKPASGQQFATTSQVYIASPVTTASGESSVAFKMIPALNSYTLSSVTATCANPGLTATVVTNVTYKYIPTYYIAIPCSSSTSGPSSFTDNSGLRYSNATNVTPVASLSLSAISEDSCPTTYVTKGQTIYARYVKSMVVDFTVTVKNGSTTVSTNTYTKTFDISYYTAANTAYEFSLALTVDSNVGDSQSFTVTDAALKTSSVSLGSVNTSNTTTK